MWHRSPFRLHEGRMYLHETVPGNLGFDWLFGIADPGGPLYLGRVL